jgi:hypothetical protein
MVGEGKIDEALWNEASLTRNPTLPLLAGIMIPWSKKHSVILPAWGEYSLL